MNIHCTYNSKSNISKKYLDTFTGLEKAIILHKSNAVKDYWSIKLFIINISNKNYSSYGKYLDMK